MTQPSWTLRVVTYTLLMMATSIAVLPIYSVIVMAFSHAPGFSTVVAPDLHTLTFDHFRALVGATDRTGRWLFGRQLFNSLWISASATLIGTLLAATCAYALSRFSFPGKARLLGAFLVTQMFPATMMMVPLFVVLRTLGLLDKSLGLVLVYSTTALPLSVWMLKGYFDTLPKDLDEAARIDGASDFRIFWQIILPLARPGVAVTALFAFLTGWNEFILAATLLESEENFTLPVVLYRHVGSHGANWGAFAAGAVLVSVPVCILFLLLQKNLVSGLSQGSVK